MAVFVAFFYLVVQTYAQHFHLLITKSVTCDN